MTDQHTEHTEHGDHRELRRQLDSPVDITGVTAGDHQAERAIGARVLRVAAAELARDGDTPTTHRTIAGWLRQRADTITYGPWSS